MARCLIAICFVVALRAESLKDYCADFGPVKLRLASPIVQRSPIGGGGLEAREVAIDKPGGHRKCGERGVKGFVVENEWPVGAGVTVEGDICAAMPRFIIYGQRRAWDLYPKRFLNGRRTPDPMIDFVKIALLGRSKRCAGASIPEKIYFTGRHIPPLSGADYAEAWKGKRAPYKREDFFLATVQLKPGLRVVNDNPAQEAALLRAEEARLEAAAVAEYNRERNRAIAAALGMLVLGAAQDSCDPTLPSCR